jgi:hypothetical protein
MLALLFGFVELFKQIKQATRNRLVLNRSVQGTQFGADVRICAKAIIATTHARWRSFLRWNFIFHQHALEPDNP